MGREKLHEENIIMVFLDGFLSKGMTLGSEA